MKDFILSTQALSQMVKPIQKSIINNPVHQTGVIGLSGASGFLALHLIEAFQKENKVKHIKAFVRSKEKFLEKKEYFRLNIDMKNIEIIEKTHQKDFENIEHFFHCAATLNSVKSAKALWENVTLTEHYLNQCEGVFHYISTLSVFASSNQTKVVPELLTPSSEHLLYGGYAQTKWLGEYLASLRGAKIYRLGLLTPSETNPIFQPHEFFRVLLKTLKSWGVYPENYTDALVDISPVDKVAQHILASYQDNQMVRHIAGEKRLALSQVIQTLELKPVSEQAWLEKLNSLRATEQVLMNYTFFKPQALENYFHYFNIDLFQSTNHDWCGTIPSLPLKIYLEYLDEEL